MTECSCITTKYVIRFYKRRKPTFWKSDIDLDDNPFYKTFTIHGNSIKEINDTLIKIQEELLIKYPDKDYKMFVSGVL